MDGAGALLALSQQPRQAGDTDRELAAILDRRGFLGLDCEACRKERSSRVERLRPVMGRLPRDKQLALYHRACDVPTLTDLSADGRLAEGQVRLTLFIARVGLMSPLERALDLTALDTPRTLPLADEELAHWHLQFRRLQFFAHFCCMSEHQRAQHLAAARNPAALHRLGPADAEWALALRWVQFVGHCNIEFMSEAQRQAAARAASDPAGLALLPEGRPLAQAIFLRGRELAALYKHLDRDQVQAQRKLAACWSPLLALPPGLMARAALLRLEQLRVLDELL